MRGRRLLFVGSAILFFVVGLAFATLFADIPAPSAQTAGTKPASPESFSGLVKEARDSVVNISTVKIIKREQMFESPFGRNDPFNDMFERFFGDRIPRESRQTSLGSGFIIDKNGFILTNNHVVEQTDEIKVMLSNGTEYDAEIVGRDPKTDLALIRIEAEEDLKPLPLGDSEELEVGDWVLAIGNPFGLDHTLTVGVVSAKGRTSVGITDYEDFIQTDAAINPGNSGGPLINLKGEAIGINSAIFSQSGGYMGIGFAIPINMAKDLLPQLKKGKVIRGWLGVMIQGITPGLKESFGLKEEIGALVSEVTPGGPAEEAGIKEGDVIVSFDGREIQEMSDLPMIVASTPVGKIVTVEVIREGKKKRFEVKIDELEEEIEEGETPGEEKRDLGMTVDEITPSVARQLDLSDERGVVVVRVESNSPAEKAGIARGDVIREINREPVNDVGTYMEKIRQHTKGDVILFRIKKRGGPTLFVPLKVEE
ncbi:MAG: DegQ family serine endoprotease [Deltaproteobacteria bacterium]|nr:DegQ family serine endoprotease [Deltaproteobacteria bacterium]